ncbi:MAG: CapA family protein [Patescibacteria group bacterium]
MRFFYFFIFLLILLGAAGYLYFSRQYVSFLSSAQSASLQANILALKDYAIKKRILEEVPAEEKPLTMVFVGDIMLDRGVEAIIGNYENYRYPFLKTFEILKSADLAFGNLEGPISKNGEKQGSIYSFRFEPQAIDGLKFAGFDVLSLANNHILDYGRKALEDTVLILKENSIIPIGAGENYLEANSPIIKEISGVKIAFLSYALMNPKSYEASKDYSGISSFELERVENEVKMIKTLSIADIVVVSFHWGEEYQTRSNKKQQEIGRALAEAGADLIIGHHPHVVQELERYKNSWIAYSLGNFIFDQNFSDETMNGLMLKAEIQDKKIKIVEPIDLKIGGDFQPQIIQR